MFLPLMSSRQSNAGAGAALTPEQIGSGLVAWWDITPDYCYSDTGMTSPTGVGGNILRIVDRVNGHILAVNAGPTLEQVGGKYVMRWGSAANAGDIVAVNSSISPTLVPSAATICARFNKSDATYSDPSQFKLLTTRGDFDSWECFTDGDAYPSAFRNPRIQMAGAGITAGKHSLSYASSATNWRRSLDGVISTQAAAYSAGDGIWVGLLRPEGDLATVFVYSTALSNDDLALADTYMESRMP